MRFAAFVSLLAAATTATAAAASPRGPLRRTVQIMDAATAAASTTPYVVTNFGAYVAADGSGAPSVVSFHFADNNAGRVLETDCTVSAPANSSLLGVRSFCNRAAFPAVDVSVTLQNGWMELQRGFQQDAATYVYAIANQSVCWDPTDTADNCGSSFATPGGTYYSHEADWSFTINEEVA